MLDQVSPGIRPPDPQQAAIRWLDGVYTITDGRPEAMVAKRYVHEVLQATFALIDGGLLTPDRAQRLLTTALELDPAPQTPPTPQPAPDRETPRDDLGRDLDPPAVS